MRQCVKTEVAGIPCHLIYNNQAMFELQEMFPENEYPLDAMSGGGRESYKATVDIFLVLAEQAELVRAYYGYQRGEIPDRGYLESAADPGDWVKMKEAVYSAVVLGTEHHVESTESVDLDLLEFQQEKNAKSPAR